MNKVHVIMLYVILILYTSCTLPDSEPVYISQESEPTEILQEEITMEIKALQEYDNYYHTGNKIFGIDDMGLHPVIITDTDDKPVNLNSFAVLDGKLYLSIMVMEPAEPDGEPEWKEYYFCQEDGVMSIVTDFPLFPDTTTIELDSAPYKIVSDDYKGTPISSVYQGTSKMNHMPVDSAAHIINIGLYFHVTAPSGTKAGLWCWPLDGNPRWLKETGRLW